MQHKWFIEKSVIYDCRFVTSSLTLVTIKLYKCNVYSTSCCIALQLIAHAFMLFCPPPVLNQSVEFVLQKIIFHIVMQVFNKLVV